MNQTRNAWLDMPQTVSLKFETKVSARELARMQEAAAKSHTTPQQVIEEELGKIIETLKK